MAQSADDATDNAFRLEWTETQTHSNGTKSTQHNRITLWLNHSHQFQILKIRNWDLNKGHYAITKAQGDIGQTVQSNINKMVQLTHDKNRFRINIFSQNFHEIYAFEILPNTCIGDIQYQLNAGEKFG